MSRYIEYHDICSAICNQQDGTGMTYEALAHAMVEIQLAPSIDLVRCGECRHCESYAVDTGEDYMTGLWCGLNQKDCMIDDFCSYGEVSEIPTGSERSSE